MTTIDPIALIHQIQALEAKHAALMAEMLEAMDTINELQRSKNMTDKFDMTHQDAHVAIFKCQDCAFELTFTPAATIETIEAEQAAHECQIENALAVALKKTAALQHCDLCDCAETIEEAAWVTPSAEPCELAVAILAARAALALVQVKDESKFIGYTPSLGKRIESQEQC